MTNQMIEKFLAERGATVVPRGKSGIKPRTVADMSDAELEQECDLLCGDEEDAPRSIVARCEAAHVERARRQKAALAVTTGGQTTAWMENRDERD